MQPTTTFTSGGMRIDAEMFRPPSGPNRGVIVVAYGSDGMIDNQRGQWATMLREYASDLSQKGFITLIPDYFLRTKTAAGSIDYKRDGAQIVAMHRNSWAETIGDAVSHAKSLAGVDPKLIGLLGFSLGGHLCLRMRSKARAIVEFFAPILDGIGVAEGTGLHVQIHHGTGDDLVSFEQNAKPIDQALRSSGACTVMHEYVGAGHGFVGTDSANTIANTRSKIRTLAFFEAIF